MLYQRIQWKVLPKNVIICIVLKTTYKCMNVMLIFTHIYFQLFQIQEKNLEVLSLIASLCIILIDK